jgi:hypothetical protein
VAEEGVAEDGGAGIINVGPAQITEGEALAGEERLIGLADVTGTSEQIDHERESEKERESEEGVKGGGGGGNKGFFGGGVVAGKILREEATGKPRTRRAPRGREGTAKPCGYGGQFGKEKPPPGWRFES